MNFYCSAINFFVLCTFWDVLLLKVSNDTDLEERVSILEVEVSFLTDDVEEMDT